MIIGLAGRYASGKDSVAKILVEKYGFAHISLSDILRSELRKRRKKITRQKLIDFANSLRAKQGNDVLARRALKKIKKGRRYVISSIRSTAELDSLEGRDDFSLVAIEASLRVRLERIKERSREDDPTSVKELREKERKEESSDPSKQQLHLIEKRAKRVIRNDSTLKALEGKVARLLKDISPVKKGKAQPRPSWDEYFLAINREISRRGTCDRGRASCVIVKDKRILATGYAGAPHGMPHCDEEGHLMHKVVNDDGSISNHCVRTAHAEQNALAQAAKHGIAIEGSTAYLNMEPCFTCAKILVNAGVLRVVCERRYHGARLTRSLFKQAGIAMDVLEDALEEYANQ